MGELDSAPGEVRLRQALYGGWMGASGVVLAWVAWIVTRAWSESWRTVVLAPSVGAAVGLFVEFVGEHVRASGHEARGEPEPAPPSAEGGKAPSTVKRLAGRALSFALLFLGGACENLVGDRIASLWRPFLITVLTFFPVGAVFAWRLHARAFHHHSLLSNLVHGGLSGLLAGAVAVGVGLGLGTLPPVQVEAGSAAWEALAAMLVWWGLLGVAFGAALSGSDSPSLVGPALGVLGLLGAMVLSALPAWWIQTGSGLVSGALGALRPATALVLTHPGLPAHVLAEAEQGLGLPAAPEGSELGARLWRGMGCHLPAVTAPPVRVVLASESDPRFRALCKDLRLGSQSGLLRSWLVLLLFSVGLGWAHVLEARLRPADYAGSGTARRDLVLAGLAASLLLLAWVALHSGAAGS